MEDDLRKLRVRFQRALLGLLRTDDRSSEFLVLEDTLRALGALAENTEAEEVWTQCREWIESIRTSRERPKPGYIRFLRTVDQSLKIWLDIGQNRFEAREIPRLREALNSLASETAVPRQATSDPLDEGGVSVTHRSHPASAEPVGDSGDPIQSQAAEPAPEEIRSVISGLAAHPAWDEGAGANRDAGEGKHQDRGAPGSGISAAAHEAPGAAPREPKDRVPLSNLLPRLDRIVLQTGRDLAKPVELVFHEGGYLDRSVLKGLLKPLEQIVRNAIYYGIEPMDARLAASKPRVGQLAVTLHRGTSDARLELKTDGLAIDFDRLRRKGEQMGLLATGGESAREELLQCLTATGFSTAHSATQMAGYGIGLDAARAALETLGGRLLISDHQGESLCFVLYLPAGCCGPPELASL
jgi:hypothetical protein